MPDMPNPAPPPPTASPAPATPAPPAPSAPAPIDNAAAETHLQHRLATQWDNLLANLTSSHFYVEMGLIVLALLAGYLLAEYFRKRARAHLALHPPQKIDIEFLTKPLRLLAPLLTIPFLWAVDATVTQAGVSSGAFTHGTLQMVYAYLFVSCVFMVVRHRAVAWFISIALIVNAALHAVRVARSVSAYLDSIAYDAGPYHVTALHLVHGFFIFVVVFWGAGVLANALESYLRRSTRLSASSRQMIVRFFRIFVYVIAISITLSAVGIDLTAFAIFSGALGVGIGLGLQKVTSNFVSGVTMLMERSIKLGDLIEVGGYTGWVRQLNIRYLLLETSDGREVIIPNEELVSSRVVNWTLTTTEARIEIKVVIGFDSDAEKARDLMLAAATEHPLCLRNPPPSCVLREFTGAGIAFTLAFWIADVTRGRTTAQSDVMFAVLKKFAANGITLARG